MSVDAPGLARRAIAENELPSWLEWLPRIGGEGEAPEPPADTPAPGAEAPRPAPVPV
jgi:hypothetical protein